MAINGLEVYERIDDYCCLNVNRSENPFEGTEYKSVDDLVNDLEALKKYLKASEVIKKKIVDIFKVVHYERENTYYLQINFNDDTSRIIQLPLLEDEAKDIENLLKEVLII